VSFKLVINSSFKKLAAIAYNGMIYDVKCDIYQQIKYITKPSTITTKIYNLKQQSKALYMSKKPSHLNPIPYSPATAF